MTKSMEGALVRLPPPLVFLAMVGLGVGLQFAVRRVAWPLPFWLHLALGIVALLAGLAIGFAALGLFRKTGQDPAPWKPSPELIFGGPYRYTRNPMYVGMTLLTLGIGLIANVVWIAALALPG